MSNLLLNSTNNHVVLNNLSKVELLKNSRKRAMEHQMKIRRNLERKLEEFEISRKALIALYEKDISDVDTEIKSIDEQIIKAQIVEGREQSMSTNKDEQRADQLIIQNTVQPVDQGSSKRVRFSLTVNCSSEDRGIFSEPLSDDTHVSSPEFLARRNPNPKKRTFAEVSKSPESQHGKVFTFSQSSLSRSTSNDSSQKSCSSNISLATTLMTPSTSSSIKSVKITDFNGENVEGVVVLDNDHQLAVTPFIKSCCYFNFEGRCERRGCTYSHVCWKCLRKSSGTSHACDCLKQSQPKCADGMECTRRSKCLLQHTLFEEFHFFLLPSAIERKIMCPFEHVVAHSRSTCTFAHKESELTCGICNESRCLRFDQCASVPGSKCFNNPLPYLKALRRYGKI
jgi:hypothetical protein